MADGIGTMGLMLSVFGIAILAYKMKDAVMLMIKVKYFCCSMLEYFSRQNFLL